MNPFDNLPKRHDNHATGNKAEAAFEAFIARSDDFVQQGKDRQDYGTDYQIEVVDRAQATNVRLHVQLKGTEKALNADGSISVDVARTTLNYLLMQERSLLVCYHVPTESMRISTADAVVRYYAHGGQTWTDQASLTVRFSERLTAERLKSLAGLARSGSVSSRDSRLAQIMARAGTLPNVMRAALPTLHVPDNPEHAAGALANLYEARADSLISAAFESFAAVLGQHHSAMTYCYMAEINLGMAGRSSAPDRIADGIAYLASRLGRNELYPASLHYSIGNGYSALDREEEAARAYEIALSHLPDEDADPFLIAQCHKNLGTSLERLGEGEEAAEHFREALRHCPELPEAHHALGLHHNRKGAYAEALDHFDQVVFTERTLGRRSSVGGWRINTLFNLGEERAAFREITGLLGDAEQEEWIWPWCAKQVSYFSRTNPVSAKLSLLFWDRYLKAHPKCPGGLRERLLNKLYLRSETTEAGLSYAALKEEFEATIEHVEGEALAYLWDRLGHWAQDENNWADAEHCFRVAYEIDGGHYSYCLGTALNFLDRYEEALPILLEQATKIQPDGMSWFQVAVAQERLDLIQDSIAS